MNLCEGCVSYAKLNNGKVDFGKDIYEVSTHPITSHHITSHPITSHHITLHPITSHPITSHHITSHPITSHPITSHPITSHPPAHIKTFTPLQIVHVKECPVCSEQPCVNGGKCKPSYVTQGFECQCEEGYSGSNCQIYKDQETWGSFNPSFSQPPYYNPPYPHPPYNYPSYDLNSPYVDYPYQPSNTGYNPYNLYPNNPHNGALDDPYYSFDPSFNVPDNNRFVLR